MSWKRRARRRADIEYTLFESRDRLGGSLASETVNGVVLERGPDSFLSEKQAGAELCRELGLTDQLTPSNDANRKTYIVVKNRLVPLPDGLMFLIPTKLVPTALSGLFSPATKIQDGFGTAASAAAKRAGRVGGCAGAEGTWARKQLTGLRIRCCRGSMAVMRRS